MGQNVNPPRGFPRLALATTLLTLGLIVFGAVVRVTDSGLGCGEHWPLCNGTIFPPLDNVTAWIEWLHRLFAALIGVLGIAMLVVAVRAYRTRNPRVLTITVIAAVLFAVQSALGAIVVLRSLPVLAVTLHLATAMLLLGALLLAAVVAAYRPGIASPSNTVSMLAYTTAALAFVIILSGALVRGSGATLACTDWPLCFGQVLPTEHGSLAIIHMFHRFAVVALGISIVLLAYYVFKERQDQRLRTLAIAALIAYFAQAGVGAMFVISRAQAVWGAAHVGLAATTWALLVAFSAIEWLNNHTSFSEITNKTWDLQSKASK
ncbi:MAG: COX15/CtaA family protein [Chloroflexi bacterium]|nr:COX15/CtaA family protein [Chloroflexota bacterium]MCC6895526.1 heme A synthase [Anaerolineae bacterium]